MSGPWERYGATGQTEDDGPWARYGGRSAESQVAEAGGSNEDHWRKVAAKASGGASLSAPVRGPWERFTDAATEYSRDMLAGPIGRSLNIGILSGDAWRQQYDPDFAGDPLRGAQQEVRAARDEEREAYNIMATADPWNNPKLKPWEKFAAGASTLGGLLAGSIAGEGPVALIGGPSKSLLARMGVQAGIAGSSDALGQTIDLSNAQRDSYDPVQIATSAGAGAGFEALGSGVRAAVRGLRNPAEAGPSPEAPVPDVTVRGQLSMEEADALTLHGINVDTLTDVNAAKVAAAKLMERNPPQAEAPPVIATRHGNIAPNADDLGRAPETRAANAGDERRQFESRVRGVESGGNDRAQNSRSSADGRYQFTDDTFVRYYQRRFGQKDSRESILAKKFDTNLQEVLMRDLTNDNEAVLRNAGVPLSSGNYYLAHFAGSGGAVKLHKNMDAPVEDVLGQKVVDANPFLAGMRGRDVIAWAEKKMGGEAPEFRAGGHAVDWNDAPGPRQPEPAETIYRAPDFSDTSSPDWDAANRPQRMGEAEPFDTGNMGQGDNPTGRQSATAEELAQPGARGEGMATGGMERPFKDQPGTDGFEAVQRERVKQAEADVEKRWEARRAEAERLKAEFEARKNRAGQSDASARYQTFGSKPHYDADTGFHRTTDDGFVADVDGNPVVWPSQGAAAKWAARFKMGGDFELQAHGTSARNGDQKVTLQRKPNSTYGQPAAPEARAPDMSRAPAQLEGPWARYQETTAPAEPANVKGGDTSAVAEDIFPGDLPRARPVDPGKEPPRPRNFMASVAEDLAERSRKAGINVRIDAEDAISKGVPAEYIYHNPKAKYPTVKAGAAKVFTSSKAPLSSRAKPVKIVSLDDLGDRFDPAAFGRAAGDGVQSHRLDPEDAGDLMRQSFEKDPAARDRADPRYEAHADWEARMDELEEFERRYGDDWQSMSDRELDDIDAQLDGALGKLHDEVLHAADTGATVDPGDPRFWDTDYGRNSREIDEPEAQGRGREDIGDARGDAGEQAERAAGPTAREDGQLDAFGQRAGDERRSLERKGDEPLRGTKTQKAPGEDGGLFDPAGHGRQGSFGRKPPFKGAEDDPVIKAARARDERFHEADRRESIVDRAKATAKALLDDETGSLDLDAVAKFLVDSDTVRDAKAGLKRLAASLKGSSARDVLAKTLDSSRFAGRFIASYFHSVDARMRGLAARFDSETIRELADMFHARAGRADGTTRTYHEAVEFNARRWNKQLFDVLERFAKDADAMVRIRDILTNTGRGSAEEREAAKTVAKLLKEIHDYRRDAGEDLGEVTDGYFPRSLDADVVVANGDEFKKIAADLFVKAGDSAADAKAKADVWFHQVVNEHAGLDGSILDVRRAKAPGTTSGLARKLPKEADALLAKFYLKDPLDVLSAYITGSAKRAEFNRRFGVPGREGSPAREKWIAEHGFDDQLDVIRKKIDDEILASGRDPADAQDQINSFLEANLGILGKASTSFRLGVSLMHGYNQIAKMDHSLITSLNELAMGVVRSGSLTNGLKFVGTTFKEFGREIARMEPTEARRYAEHLGVILNANMDQVLQSRISAVESTRGVNKVIARFYRVIGLHQFTEATRIAAAKMAREHLNALAGDLASTNARTARRAERALAELGVTDHKAFSDFLAARGGKVRFDEIDADKAMAATWSTAVARMTNQTVMNPTRAVKPLWANHPLGSLLYGLMSYTFAFKKNVLDRVGNMAVRGVKEKDPALFAPALLGLPTLAAFTYLNDTFVRPTLFGSTYDFENESEEMAMLRTADRASLLGALSPFANVMFGQKYNRSLSEAFMGSFAGSISQGVEKIVVKPVQAKVKGTEGNGAERGAAGAIYDLMIEPMIDAGAVAGVGGAVATGVVYGTGARPGSIFPQDRETFIEALAGPEEKKGKDKDPFAFEGAGKSPFDKAFKDATE